MPLGSTIKNALDGVAGMRYSVCVSGRVSLAYYSPEMTGFYDRMDLWQTAGHTIALPEMAGFYNPDNFDLFFLLTIALPETAGL